MLSRHLRTHLIVAPSTSVGKSIFSTGLVRASLALGEKVGYLKPVGTGSGDGDDELCVPASGADPAVQDELTLPPTCSLTRLAATSSGSRQEQRRRASSTLTSQCRRIWLSSGQRAA